MRHMLNLNTQPITHESLTVSALFACAYPAFGVVMRVSAEEGLESARLVPSTAHKSFMHEAVITMSMILAVISATTVIVRRMGGTW